MLRVSAHLNSVAANDIIGKQISGRRRKAMRSWKVLLFIRVANLLFEIRMMGEGYLWQVTTII